MFGCHDNNTERGVAGPQVPMVARQLVCIPSVTPGGRRGRGGEGGWGEEGGEGGKREQLGAKQTIGGDTGKALGSLSN